MQCPECGHQVDHMLHACPHCNHRLGTPAREETRSPQVDGEEGEVQREASPIKAGIFVLAILVGFWVLFEVLRHPHNNPAQVWDSIVHMVK